MTDRAFRMETAPEGQLRVGIQQMRLSLKNSGRRIWVSVDVNDPFNNIHKALDECLNKENLPLTNLYVVSPQSRHERVGG
jgi:hypothetical protein